MASLNRRSLLAGSAAAGVVTLAGPLRAQETPGVTATEIKIGCTTSLSGPVSALGTIAKCSDAYFRMMNDQGGIAGRKINFIYYDDAFNPAKTVEQVRKLIESDNVAFLFSMLGTAPNSAVVKYINSEQGAASVPVGERRQMGRLPELSLDHGLCAELADRGADIRQIRAEPEAGCANSRCSIRTTTSARISSTACATCWDRGYDQLVKAVSYEVTDPTIDSPDRCAALEQCRCPDFRRHREIRRPGDPESFRTRLEADAFRHQRRGVGGFHHHAGRAGARGRG